MALAAQFLEGFTTLDDILPKVSSDITYYKPLLLVAETAIGQDLFSQVL